MYRNPSLIVLLVLCLSALVASPNHAADEKAKPKFELKDGDRVAFIGNTFIEREQQSGYIELALTLQHPNKHITFRNLGWSGDNVYGESRARFGSVQDGFKHLIDNAKAVKPTVLIVSYGHNAAFAGENGVDKFIKGYERLLDALQKDVLGKDGRIVLITPHEMEKHGPPLPDPSHYIQYLWDYTAAIEKMGQARGHQVLKLGKLQSITRDAVLIDRSVAAEPEIQGKRIFLTDNTQHLNQVGYWQVANTLFGPGPVGDRAVPQWVVDLKADGKVDRAIGAKVSDTKRERDDYQFMATDLQLPLPPVEVDVPAGRSLKIGSREKLVASSRILSVQGAKPGRYEVRIDGKRYEEIEVLDPKKDPFSELRVSLENNPVFAQVEKLRKTIIAKNELFFHRWRPANETYIYLFRKHEQGNNAKEMPMFDPLIEAKEKEIAKLRKPGTHKYEIVRVED